MGILPRNELRQRALLMLYQRFTILLSFADAGNALSRRSSLTGLAASCVAASVKWSWAAASGGGPVFSAGGLDAERYGATEDYPVKDRWRVYQPGNPASPKYRVGAFSRYDEIFPTRLVNGAATAWPFKRSKADVTYHYNEHHPS